MTTSIRRIIRAAVAPRHKLSCARHVWQAMQDELARRGDGRRESGAFLLGLRRGDQREVVRYVAYDDLDPACLRTGIIRFSSEGYEPLWRLCRKTGLSVIADVHTHPGAAGQSEADRLHPMIAEPGHIALIIPNFAQGQSNVTQWGVYRYRGSYEWESWCGTEARRRLYFGWWA